MLYFEWSNIMMVIINNTFEAFYICCWIIFMQRQYHKYFIKEEIRVLNKKQDILFEAIKKLKNIIDIDSCVVEDLKNKITRELEKINCGVKRMDSSDEKENKEEKENKGEKENKEEEILIENNIENGVYPIQSHISFPHYIIYSSIMNKSKSKVISKDGSKILSKQLCDFLSCEHGTTMGIRDVSNSVLELCNVKKRTGKIQMTQKLRKLFGIMKHEDYEVTVDNLLIFLEPHLK